MSQEIQHTPGPWAADESRRVKTLDGKLIADCMSEDITSLKSEKANARLIAAAPELLDALRYARRFLNSSEHDTSYVDAAIAKATGQSDQKDSQ